MLTSAILMLVLGLGLPSASPQEPAHAVRVEWRVREWALDVGAHAAPIEKSASAQSWEERFSAQDALARAAPGSLAPEQLELARRALGDAHPNVRAQGFAALAAAGASPLPAPPLALAPEPFPEARRQRARALGRVPGAEADAALLALTADEDERVAREATDQLLSRGPGSARAQLALWETGLFDRDAEAFLHALDVLERSPLNLALYQRVRAHYEAPASAESPAPGRQARRALWLYLGDFHHWFADPELLVDGWLDPMGEEGSSVERERRAKLLEAAAKSGVKVCEALLREATRFDRIAQEGGEGAETAAWNASLFLAGAIEAYPGAEREAEAGQYLDEWAAIGPDRSWSDELKIEFWDGVTGKVSGWPADRYRGWLAENIDPEVRAAAIAAFAETWTRTSDPGSAELLVAALDDLPLPAREAWTVLAGAVEGAEHSRELHRWWVARPLEERLEDLRFLSRDVRHDTPWREELVRLWASGEGRTVSVIELLGAHVGDPDVEAVLYRWLEETLDELLAAGDVPDEETTRGRWRETENHALWLAKAWLHVTGGRETDRAAALLARVGNLGKELGKALIAELAKSEAGRARLEELFRGDALSRRLRIEVLLLHSGLDEPADVELFFERYAACDEELKLRVAKRLGELGLPRSRELLVGVVLDPKASGVEQMIALDALGACGAAREIEPLLLRVLAECRDLDLLRAAIVALGGVGGADARVELWRRWDEHDEALGLSDVLLPALAGIELRAGGIGTTRFVDAWLEKARRNAPAELEARFRGERLPSRAFTYSGLLEAEKTLAAAGQLGRALELAGPWWRLDARLLLLMGAAARETGGPGAEALGRKLDLAALVGLLGEGDSPDRAGLIARARARLLQSAWNARDWREAEGFAADLLEDWRTGRTTRSGFEAVFGGRDPEAKSDPTLWLLATENQARAWRALEAGERARARELTRRWYDSVLGEPSERAARQQRELERALDPNGARFDEGNR